MDNYWIKRHKLHFHVDRINDWLGGKKAIAPMEISPPGACNHCSQLQVDNINHHLWSLTHPPAHANLT